MVRRANLVPPLVAAKLLGSPVRLQARVVGLLSFLAARFEMAISCRRFTVRQRCVPVVTNQIPDRTRRAELGCFNFFENFCAGRACGAPVPRTIRDSRSLDVAVHRLHPKPGPALLRREGRRSAGVPDAGGCGSRSPAPPDRPRAGRLCCAARSRGTRAREPGKITRRTVDGVDLNCCAPEKGRSGVGVMTSFCMPA